MATVLEERLTKIWETPNTLWGSLTTVDHKTVGKRYLLTATAFLIIGGLEALLMRLQLARAQNALLTPEEYDQVFTIHGLTMIFWYAAPILSGFANYFIPLLIGSRDMAFPRLNAFSYWSFLFSGLFLYGGPAIGQAPHGGWFAYVPYTSKLYSPGLGMDFYALALIFLTISTEAGAMNFIVTIEGQLQHQGNSQRRSQRRRERHLRFLARAFCPEATRANRSGIVCIGSRLNDPNDEAGDFAEAFLQCGHPAHPEVTGERILRREANP